MYLSMAKRSGAEREKRWPLGGLVPERRSMAQLYDRWGGSDVAWLLLNTSPRSWYSDGTVDKPGGGYVVGLDVGAGMVADWRHMEWHSGFQPVMRPLTQSTWGLCFLSQGLPKTNGTRGETENQENHLRLMVVSKC